MNIQEIERTLKVKPFWWYWLHPKYRKSVRRHAQEIVSETQDYQQNWASAEGEPHELTQENNDEELHLEL